MPVPPPPNEPEGGLALPAGGLALPAGAGGGPWGAFPPPSGPPHPGPSRPDRPHPDPVPADRARVLTDHEPAPGPGPGRRHRGDPLFDETAEPIPRPRERPERPRRPRVGPGAYGRRRGWRAVVGGAGKTLIGAGLLLLAFVVYQLWGTGLQTASAQRSLDKDFAAALASTTTTAAPTTTTVPPATAPPATAPDTVTTPTTVAPTTTTVAPVTPMPAFGEGDVVGQIEIPKIDVDWKFVYGVDVPDLKKGPGHYPETPYPGHVGNSAIAGHRTTYKAPFFRVNELAPGDEIWITTVQGRFRYLVTEQLIVAPTDRSVLDATPGATLTLTSCHPRYSARQRIVIKAVLDEATTPAIVDAPAAPAEPSTTTTAPASAPAVTAPGTIVEDDPTVTAAPSTMPTAAPAATTAGSGKALGAESGSDTFSRGWFSDANAWLPTILFGLLAATLGIGAHVGHRTWRRWLPYAIGVVPFLVVLYFFFENVSRLLPPNL